MELVDTQLCAFQYNLTLKIILHWIQLFHLVIQRIIKILVRKRTQQQTNLQMDRITQISRIKQAVITSLLLTRMAQHSKIKLVTQTSRLMSRITQISRIKQAVKTSLWLTRMAQHSKIKLVTQASQQMSKITKTNRIKQVLITSL